MSGYRSRKISRPHTEWVRSGAGYFTSKFSMSEEGMKYITPKVIQLIKTIRVNSGSAFTIADYGCADGGTSMPLMDACVKELRSLYGSELEVYINYEDTPENDFNSLFYFLQGLLPGSSSYLKDFPNVFVSATGTSFYQQCLPSESVNFGFSSLAVQCLSQKPCNLTKALVHCLSEIQDERNEFTKQAEKDWEQFLLMRAKELAKGGKLALIHICASDGEVTSNGPTVIATYALLYKTWESMAKDNIITEDDMERLTLPEYFRTREEIAKPFMSEESPVREAGLKLVSLEMKELPLPEKTMWQVTRNAKLSARLLTEQTRAWSNSMFLSSLSDEHSEEEKNDILNEYFYRFEEEVLHSPEDYMGLIWNAFMIIEKL